MAGYQIPDTRYQIPDTRFQIPDSRYQIPDTGYQIPVSGIGHQGSAFYFPAFIPTSNPIKLKFANIPVDKETGAIKMSNGANFRVIDGAGGTNGPEGPSKFPTRSQFLNVLRKSRFYSLRKIAVVYNPMSSLSQIKNLLEIKKDKGIVCWITQEILRRKFVGIEDLNAYVRSPDAKERFIAAGFEELELNLLVDLMLDKEESVSWAAKETFYQRELSKAEFDELRNHPEKKIREALLDHDSYFEYVEGPESAQLDAVRQSEEDSGGVTLELVRETDSPVKEKSGRDLQTPSDSVIVQTVTDVDLLKLCLKSGKTEQDYWILFNGLKKTADLHLALNIAYYLHTELFT